MAWGGLFLSLCRPSPEQQDSCLAAVGGFNYDAALRGATRALNPSTVAAIAETKPKPKLINDDDDARHLMETKMEMEMKSRGFFVNRSRLLIGSGAGTFVRAKSALLSWRHLSLGWANVQPDTAVKVGTRFCICYKELMSPCWVMLPLQIAYVDDGTSSSTSNSTGSGGTSSMLAFGSGTLQGHLLAGEERFSVQLDEQERVWYEVVSFSKPAHILAALCYPYVQLRQKHFAKQSAQALLTHLVHN